MTRNLDYYVNRICRDFLDPTFTLEEKARQEPEFRRSVKALLEQGGGYVYNLAGNFYLRQNVDNSIGVVLLENVLQSYLDPRHNPKLSVSHALLSSTAEAADFLREYVELRNLTSMGTDIKAIITHLHRHSDRYIGIRTAVGAAAGAFLGAVVSYLMVGGINDSYAVAIPAAVGALAGAGVAALGYRRLDRRQAELQAEYNERSEAFDAKYASRIHTGRKALEKALER